MPNAEDAIMVSLTHGSIGKWGQITMVPRDPKKQYQTEMRIMTRYILRNAHK